MDAIYDLAVCYYNGDVLEKNYNTAAYWFRKGAECGSAECMLGLAMCYVNGRGLVYNLDKGIYWLKNASAKGNGEAMSALGKAFESGVYFKQSNEKADKLYTACGAMNAGDTEYAMQLFYEVFPEYKKDQK